MAEVFFEFLTEDKSVVLLYEEVDRDNYSKVVLVSNKKIIYEWTTGGRGQNITVYTGYKLNDGNWHMVNIERNSMEVMVMVDRKQMMGTKIKNANIEKDPLFIFSELEVNLVLFAVNRY